jgi:hypothetical protein
VGDFVNFEIPLLPSFLHLLGEAGSDYYYVLHDIVGIVEPSL